MRLDLNLDPASARRLLNRIESVAEKHADRWVRGLEIWWTVSRNPVFAWMALHTLLDPKRPAAPLPAWLCGYLHEAADNIIGAISELEPSEVPPLLGQALGLSIERRNIVADAIAFLQAPVFVGYYEFFYEKAPAKGRAEWALRQMCDVYGLQSTTAARQRLTEAKAAVRAGIAVQGRVASKAAVSQEGAEAAFIAAVMDLLLDAAKLPKATADTLRQTFGEPPARRDAVRASLPKRSKDPSA